METWDAIRSRRNVREYTDQPIAEADLGRILDAGRRAPSSMNRQRWDFVVVTGRDRLTELATVCMGARHVPGSAATVALVGPAEDDPRTRESINFDMGQAAMSMLIVAADLGIASCHAAVGDHAGAARVLGLPGDRQCLWMLAFGYPADRPLAPMRRPTRRTLDDVVHRNRFSGGP